MTRPCIVSCPYCIDSQAVKQKGATTDVPVFELTPAISFVRSAWPCQLQGAEIGGHVAFTTELSELPILSFVLEYLYYM